MTTKTQISPSEITKLEELFTLVNKAEILAFLEQNPYLVDMLLEVPNKVHSFFPTALLGLDFYTDYEDANFQALFVLIQLDKNTNVQEATKKLNQIWGNWKFGQAQNRSEKLQITIEYI
jgi:hypothetical protein